MNISRFLILPLTLLFLLSCSEKEPRIQPDPTVDLTKSEKMLVNSGNVFGFDLLKKVNQAEEDNVNFMISPLSVATALAMTYNGASGDTKTAMEETLRLNGLTTNEINQSFQHLCSILSTLDPDVLMQIANSIWYREGFGVLADFINVNQTYYDAEVAALDFNNPGSVDVINNWVANQTNNLIPTIIDQIPAQAVMYLINAIYFKGTWTYSFQSDDTSPMPFTLADGNVVNVETMKQGGAFNYYSDAMMEAVDLPYGDEKFSMVVMLPRYGFTANDIITNLDSAYWSTITNSFAEVPEIHIYLPKFKFAYEKKLNDILSDMGMGVAFSGGADFSGIDGGQHDLFISQVKHKSFIDVSEQGTEAAAVTVVEIFVTSIPDYVDFYANRPFVFAIKEKKTGAVVFAGKVAHPTY
jgi:serine protease inhibitor